MFICGIFGESVVLYVYIYRDVYIYICSFMCKFRQSVRQSVLSTAETTFCLCVAFFVLLHVRYGCPWFLGLGK